MWDANHPLRPIAASLGLREDELFLHKKALGNFKNSEADPQISDGRGRNFVEGRIDNGPFHEIPNATTLLQLDGVIHLQECQTKRLELT